MLVGLTACGGGADTSGTPTSPTPASLQQTLANLVIDVTSPGLVTEGSFDHVTGYLAKSPQVLRSNGAASARFALQVPYAGHYEVFVWWPQNLADAGAADITVEYNGGHSTVSQSQRSGGGAWQSLGTYPFDPSIPGALLLRSVNGAPLYVDAVRLQYLGQRAPAMAFASDKLPVGLKDEPYIAQLSMSAGMPPYSYAIVDGELPPGLVLDGATGDIIGRPAYSGEFTFTVRSQDAKRQLASQTMTLYIGESAGTASTAPGLAPRPFDVPSARRQSTVATAGTPDVSNLLAVVAGMAEGEWRRVNLNAFSSVWTPPDLRPLYGWGNPTPSRIILAWSGFAWDSNRATLLIYGGGHGNYRGNDVYLWRASTQMWERASLPSEMVQTQLGYWNAIDGVDKAPASAHTYDNTIFLPILDRMLVLGGAADPNGGHYLTQATATTARVTGPYLFDPSRAHADRVGGSTGSHVKRVAPYPEIVGGNMWSNRESWLNASASSKPPVEALTNGCTGYAVEAGRDVVYVRTAYRLYRYEISDLATPAADVWKQVNSYYYGGSGGQSTCAYDPLRKIFLSTHLQTPFIFWDLSNSNAGNRDKMITPVDPSGEFPTLLSTGAIHMSNCGLEFDPVRNDFKLWCGDGRVWTVTPPPTPVATGWTIVKASLPPSAVPTESLGTGILGKWKYVPNLDVFMGLADSVQGNIWIYKPHGWVNPAGTGNLPPSVSITAPANGASFTEGAGIVMSATATDVDGSVAKVEFFADSNKIGESLAAPFEVLWSGAMVGAHTLTAVATDDAGATKTSALVTVLVNPVVVPNNPPTVNLVHPTPGTTVPFGTPVTLEAAAGDSDGTVVRVEFYVGVVKLGEATAAPFTFVWTSPPLGASALSAVATDDQGASTTSAVVSITVSPASGGTGAVTLQRGAGPFVVADAYLSNYHQTLNFGANTSFQDKLSDYSSLMRFAIFQSEGGPVPNGTKITSATLSLYKFSYYNMVYGVHRVLVDWSESSATWNRRLPGLSWSTAGANGLGMDIAATPDALASINFNPGWINFDVTSSVQGMSLAPSPANFGWRLKGVSGYTSAIKMFYSSEFAGMPSLRPKLVITYE
ncbi:Ig-like domain-containing protein [Rhodoferax ferrireducens]|uniref:Ig-like domain-containing protein n=1 Tax=Rhodoferax ferrireducens TaxID=192843 RepID=UPI003BB75BF7